ncbi:hypothetical protein N2152v2_006366 [Parachlorella kessleri]
MAAALPSSFFTLEDTKLTKAAEAALSSFAILSAAHSELPVLYASGRCCELLRSTKADVAMHLAPASIEALTAALEGYAPVSLRLFGVEPVDATFLPVTDASSGRHLFWVASMGAPAATTAAAAATAEVEAEAPGPDKLDTVGVDADNGPLSGSSSAAFFNPAVLMLTVDVVSNRFTELLGYTVTDLVSGGWHNLVGDGTAWDVVLKIDAAVSNGEPARLRRINTYSMGRVIGQGTFGTVRVGKDQATGELVALKLVDTRNLKHLDELQARQLQYVL